MVKLHIVNRPLNTLTLASFLRSPRRQLYDFLDNLAMLTSFDLIANLGM